MMLGVSFPALAEDLPPLMCEGVAPLWTLELSPNAAAFTYAGKDTDMTIPQRTVAANAEFPKALTLIGGRETAIVILNARSCDTSQVTAWPYEANVLTQKGETPVILAGCCTTAD